MSQEKFEAWYRSELSEHMSGLFVDAALAKAGDGRYLNLRVEQNWKVWQAALDKGWNDGYHRGVTEPRLEAVRFVPTATVAVRLLDDVLFDHAEFYDEETRENISLSFASKLEDALNAARGL